MLACQQFESMNVWQHGFSVMQYYEDLRLHIDEPKVNPLKFEWRLTDWVFDIRLVEQLLPSEITDWYHLYHDVGKPICRTVDENGQQHFPNHAAVSKQIWDDNSDGSVEDKMVGELIGMDMLAHTVKGDDLLEFVKHPYAPTLLYTALAEVHSNAAHLKRFNSDGFKIKCKQLDKVAKCLLKSIT